MPKKVTRKDDKQLHGVLRKVEATESLVKTQVVQLRNLSEVLKHWGGLIRVTQVMRQAVIDSEQWVGEINAAIQAMRKRTVFAARKLRAIIAAYEDQNNGAQ